MWSSSDKKKKVKLEQNKNKWSKQTGSNDTLREADKRYGKNPNERQWVSYIGIFVFWLGKQRFYSEQCNIWKLLSLLYNDDR